MILKSSLLSNLPSGKLSSPLSLTLNVTTPTLLSFTNYNKSNYETADPNLGFGINPNGPKTLAAGFNRGIDSGVAKNFSKGTLSPEAIDLIRLSSTAISAPSNN